MHLNGCVKIREEKPVELQEEIDKCRIKSEISTFFSKQLTDYVYRKSV